MQAAVDIAMDRLGEQPEKGKKAPKVSQQEKKDEKGGNGENKDGAQEHKEGEDAASENGADVK